MLETVLSPVSSSVPEVVMVIITIEIVSARTEQPRAAVKTRLMVPCHAATF